MMPKELVHLYIIDPKTMEPLKGAENIDSNDLLDKNYLRKHQAFIFNISQPAQELNTFIEKFLDDKHGHYYVSEDRV